jgi:hypothetical protein
MPNRQIKISLINLINSQKYPNQMLPTKLKHSILNLLANDNNNDLFIYILYVKNYLIK